MRIHIVAVAGTGMGSLAGLLKELGHDVSGSDVAFDPPMGPALESWGIRCLKGFDPANLEPKPDLVVIGNVCRRDNVEARAAIDGGLDYTHIAGALQRFVLDRTRPLVVAGTHGKTTTTSLAAWLLEAAGLAPGFLIGGIPKNFGRGFRVPKARLPVAGAAGASPAFVIEGDEYDTAFFEKTAKFLHYRPEVLVVTSIEHDHIDIYPTEESYVDAFRKVIENVPDSGLIVANGADPRVVALVRKHARADVAWYAIEGNALPDVAPHWVAALAHSADSEKTAFDLFAGGVACGRFVLPMTGRHNVENALAAIGATAQGYGARLDRVGAGLTRFEGIKRRQDVVAAPGGVTVVDDFAHHPTAVRQTLASLKARYPDGRLFAVFEPRSATACRALHQRSYGEAFDAADQVLLAPLGRDLPVGERLDLEVVACDASARGTPSRVFASIDAIVTAIATETHRGDVVALLSNGSFGGALERVVKALEARARSSEAH